MSDSSPNPSSPEPVRPPSSLHGYRAVLHQWLLRRLRNPDLADDAAQEVFLRLAGARPTKFIRDPRSYLFGIAFHVISEMRCAEQNARTVYSSNAVARAADSPRLAIEDTLADRLSLERQLQRAFEQLPPNYRTVLLLCKRDGMSYEEAAAASGLSVHTVEKYLVKARARLMALTWDR